MTVSLGRLRAHAVAWLAIASLFPLACGRRGAPVPPRPVAPAAVEGIRAEGRDDGIVVSWIRPSRNEDGSRLTDLTEFRLFRAVGGAGPETRPAFTLLATIRAEQPDNAHVQDGLFTFRDDGGPGGLVPGTRYFYRVQAVNRRGVAGPPSADVFVDLRPASAPPTGLTATAGDGVVDLHWQAPAAPPPAGAPRRWGYNIYRGLQPRTYGSQPINAAPAMETRYQDAGLKNGTTYYYVVRSVTAERPPWRESADSNEVSATPVDLTPPAPPTGLVAAPAAGAIALRWDTNLDADLLGYLVYRREPPTLTPIRLTETPIQATTFTDRSARPGGSYLYTVTAVDRSPRRNESLPSAEVPAGLP